MDPPDKKRPAGVRGADDDYEFDLRRGVVRHIKFSKNSASASTCKVPELPRGLSRRANYRKFGRRKKPNLDGACVCWGAGKCPTCRAHAAHYAAVVGLRGRT